MSDYIHFQGAKFPKKYSKQSNWSLIGGFLGACIAFFFFEGKVVRILIVGTGAVLGWLLGTKATKKQP